MHAFDRQTDGQTDVDSKTVRMLRSRTVKTGFSRRKSATKLLCVKSFSGKVVRHSLPYLSVHKWLVGDVPFCVKFWVEVMHHIVKR